LNNDNERDAEEDDAVAEAVVPYVTAHSFDVFDRQQSTESYMCSLSFSQLLETNIAYLVYQQKLI
jgi:hypothetical protein